MNDDGDDFDRWLDHNEQIRLEPELTQDPDDDEYDSDD